MRRTILITTLVFGFGFVLVACGGPGDTGPPAATPPTAPSNVTATAGPGYATVGWADNSEDETGFAIYRDDGTDGSALRRQAEAKAGEVAADVVEFVDMGVVPGTSPTYRVTAMNEHGISESAATSEPVRLEPGVDLMVGTNDRRYDDGTGTVFVVYLFLPESVRNDGGVDFDIAITGPDGWNGGAVHEYSESAGGFARTGGFDITSENDVDAVAGGYELTVTIGSEVYTASATLRDAVYKIGPPTDIVVTERSPSEVTVTWNAPSAAESALVSLWRGDYEEFVAGYVITTDTTTVFGGLSLEDDRYRIEVAPVNVDVSGYPIKVDDFGISYDSRAFLIGGAVADACAGPSEIVTVPDAALAAAVRARLGLSGEDITCEDMALLPRLDVVEAGITSLEGLQYAVNLGALEAAGNDIADLAPLAGLDRLEWLNLNENLVGDLGPLAGLTGLRGLFLCCASNDYDDLAPLANLARLEQLDIGGHAGIDIAPLADLVELRVLWVWDNEISDPSFLAGLSELTFLELGGNQLQDVTFVDGLPNLERLILGYNPLTDLAPLYDETQLVELDLEALGLVDSDIDFLQEFTNLEVLDLAHNDLTTIAPLTQNDGFGSGDFIRVVGNLLDLSDGSGAMADVQSLIDRGVRVEYESQSE